MDSLGAGRSTSVQEHVGGSGFRPLRVKADVLISRTTSGPMHFA